MNKNDGKDGQVIDLNYLNVVEKSVDSYKNMAPELKEKLHCMQNKGEWLKVLIIYAFSAGLEAGNHA